MKRIISLLLCAFMLASCFLLASCDADTGKGDDTVGDKDTAESITGDVEYAVSVKDYLGTPYTTGIIVQFMSGDEQVAMQAVDASGVAKKTLPAGDYELKLSYTDDEDAYYCAELPSLTAAEPACDVIIAGTRAGDPTVVVTGDEEYNAYDISVGCTYLELDTEKRNYFLFTPTQSGHYEFSVADGADVTIGNCGSPHFIQNMNSSEVVDGKFAIDIKAGMINTGDGGTVVCVIGIDAGEDDSCVLAINRTGEATKTVEDEPWTPYIATHTPDVFTLPEGSTIKEFDLTASTDTYNFVLDEATGYYHLDSVDGPLVLVRLAVDCDYIACYATISQKQGIVKYFYDGEKVYENFIKKEDYTQCIVDYIACADEAEGVYPLTEDLMYIIQQNGDHLGWWNTEGSNYRFLNMDNTYDLTINTEIAWLLMCCYAE